MSPRSWPDGEDPIAVELRRAFEEAQGRGPDDVTLRRGWAAINSRPAWGRRPKGWSWFAGGMASTAAVAVACAALLWPRAVETPVARVSDRPAVTPPAGESAMTTTTGTETRRVTLDGGVVAQLEGSSVMRIDRGAARVEEGAVRFSVPQRRPGQPFVVRAQKYRVVVLGTKFGVAVRGNSQVDVDVAEGVVEIWSDVRVARLERGQSWHSTPAETTAAPAAPAAEPQAPAAPTRVAPEPERVVAPPAAHRASRRHAAHGSSRVVAIAAPEPAAPPRTGPGAENAAYEIGKALSERGRPTAAVEAWRRYRADYPNGILRVEADVSIIETLARAGETEDALAEATDFLRRRPDSERRGEIARVAGDLYRARGECRQAVSAYQLALSATRSRDVAEAAGFHRAACLVRLGDAAGIEAARSYLRAHPDGRFRKQAAALVEQGVAANQ